MRISLPSRLAILLSLFTLASSAVASADSLSGHVRDQAANPVPSAVVQLFDSSTNALAASTTTAADGFYTVPVADGNYEVQVTPPSGSGLGPTSTGIDVAGDSTLDFALPSTATVTLSGRILDRSGAGIPNQILQLIPTGGESGPISQTDSGGNFSFTTTAGSHFVVISGNNQNFTADAPLTYSVQTAPFLINTTTTMDLPLPLKQVVVHVQSASAVANAAISSTNAFNCQLTIGPLSACGFSNYPADAPALPTTNGSGNATLFLFASPPADPDNPTYSFTATPPPASGLAAGGVTGVVIVADATVNITLAPPKTLSGTLADGLSAGLASQSMQLIPEGQESGTTTTTNAVGHYSFGIQPGNYRLVVTGDNQSFTAAAPQSYSLQSGLIAVSADQVKNFQLPVKHVHVHVQNAGNAAVSGVGLSTSSVSNCGLSFGGTTACGTSGYQFDGVTGVTDAGGNVDLWLFATPPPDPAALTTSYTFTAIPPAASGFASTSVSGISFSGDTTVTITLASPATVSGTLLDGASAGLANQFVEFAPDGSGAAVDLTTDGSGHFSVNLAPGDYRVNLFGDNQDFTAAAPQFYNLAGNTFHVSASQTLNLPLPVKRLDVHVQDLASNPIPNVGLSAFGASVCPLTVGSTTACGSSFYFYTAPLPGDPPPTVGVTNSSGNLALWLFPTVPAPNPSAYSITATPLGDSGFDPATAGGVTLTGNASLVIVLSGSHARPVTTLAIDPVDDGDGNYPDPVTITLSATAASGFFIDTIYYTVDGGAQQVYAGPFNVSGNGGHTITYLSSDSGGVIENEKTFTFTILTPDPIPPTTTAVVSPFPNGAGWNNTSVSVLLNATDDAGGSGVQQITYSVSGAQVTASTTVAGSSAVVPVTAEGTSTVTFAAVDNAGNFEADQTITVKIDKTTPATTAILAPAPNGAGWNNTNTTVALNATDGGSGVLQITYSVSGAQSVPSTVVAGHTASVSITAEGTSSVSFFATDNANNGETSHSATVKLDKTGPTITVTTPVSGGVYGLGTAVAVVKSCADSLSGFATCVAPASLDTSSVGTKTLTATSTDNADNLTTKVVTYQVGGKDQCKDNGWTLFTSPVFVNQGQCVSFFNNTPPPSGNGGGHSSVVSETGTPASPAADLTTKPTVAEPPAATATNVKPVSASPAQPADRGSNVDQPPVAATAARTVGFGAAPVVAIPAAVASTTAEARNEVAARPVPGTPTAEAGAEGSVEPERVVEVERTAAAEPARAAVKPAANQPVKGGLSLTYDATLIVVIGASHDAPDMTLALSQVPDADGAYPDHARVTLSATAASPFAIESMVYSIDGGPQQPYSAPFEVSGAGSHVIDYIATDSGGIARQKTFKLAIEPPADTPLAAPPAAGDGTGAEGGNTNSQESAESVGGDQAPAAPADVKG